MSAPRSVVATVRGMALVGLDPVEVTVEAGLGPGLPVLRLIGLPDAAVREAGDRVRAALQRCGFGWPQERLVVNLAPADLPKAGASFDLPLAIAVMVVSGDLPPSCLDGTVACGEVGLDGELRPVAGILPIARGARSAGADRLLVPDAAAPEAAAVQGLRIVPARDLREVAALLRGRADPRPVAAPRFTGPTSVADLADVRGQPVARRVLEIAAAGGHHLLLSGPPGCGKTMLARRLHGLLPPLTLDEALEVASLQGLAGERATGAPLSLVPPLREPHHSVSTAGLVGGGSGIPRPGELALAHRGMLLLDELLETPRHVLDALRQPLERGEVVITRARARVTYPARALVVAATNPCPCGDLGHPTRPCRCRPDRVERYRSRLSGPLLDRFDLQLELRPVAAEELLRAAVGEPTAIVAGRVAAARAHSGARLGSGVLQRDAPVDVVRSTCRPAALRLAVEALAGRGASARALDRTLRVAGTIADLDARERIEVPDVEEALAYRLRDPAP